MKILVLGGTRFFGVHLVNTLLLQGHEVAVATRGNAKPRFIAPVEEIRVDREHMVKCHKYQGGGKDE